MHIQSKIRRDVKMPQQIDEMRFECPECGTPWWMLLELWWLSDDYEPLCRSKFTGSHSAEVDSRGESITQDLVIT